MRIKLTIKIFDILHLNTFLISITLLLIDYLNDNS